MVNQGVIIFIMPSMSGVSINRKDIANAIIALSPLFLPKIGIFSSRAKSIANTSRNTNTGTK